MDLGYQALATGEKPRIVDVLRDAIRQRFLPPGMALIQKSVADALGVSRVPVREALQNLAAEGLVTFTGDGARVTLLSAAEIDELYSLRLLVEPAMAEPIMQNHGPTDFETFARLVGEMDEASGPDQMERWANANYAFHDALYRSSGRKHHHRIARQLLTLVEPYSRVAVFHLKGREQSQKEHHAMLDALQARDPDAFRELLRRHLLRALDDLMAYAQRPDSETRTEPASIDAAQTFATRLLGAPPSR